MPVDPVSICIVCGCAFTVAADSTTAAVSAESLPLGFRRALEAAREAIEAVRKANVAVKLTPRTALLLAIGRDGSTPKA